VTDTAGYLAVVVAMPVLAWLWLRTPLEFVTGIFLMCQAALAFNGSPYPLLSVAIVFPFAAVALIVAGVRDHRRFRDVTERIARLTGGAGA
jgi:predicted membrane metal-binding protein